MTKRLNESFIMTLHDRMIDEFGGSHGIRDTGSLRSALAAPFHGFAGTEAFPTVQQKAARLAYGLVENHPFLDGNKRIGAHSMLIFLALNGIKVDYDQQELSDLFLSVAAGEKGYDEILRWLFEHETK